MTRRILITGAGGQLGRELARFGWPAGVEILPLSSSELDITDRPAVGARVETFDPHVIINAAAYTAVDQAEEDEQQATLVNGAAVFHLAEAADRANAQLVQISTDYLFDGTKPGWYVETDPVAPLGAYGRSKAIGETAAASAERSIILRTAWVYGALGTNFVSTMLRLSCERQELGVVGDQAGCPTSAADLACAVARIVEATDAGNNPPPSKIYHLASPEASTWHEFALAIFEASAVGFSGECRELTTSEFPTKARRPANSRLASDLIRNDLEIILPSWRTSLPSVVAELEATSG